MSTPRPDDIECAMPRGLGEPWERRLLRLVEPSRGNLLPGEAEPEQPSEAVEEEAHEPTTIEAAEEAVRAAHTSADYETAIETLAKLRSRLVVAGEPPRTPPAATPAPPKTRTVLIKEILGRDSAGLISKVKEYQVTESSPEGESAATV